LSLGETIFDSDIAALEIAEITQPLEHEFDLGIGLRRAVQQNPEARNPRQLLRARNRNRNNRAANKRYKFTSSHGASEGNASTNGGNLALSAQVASYKRRSIGSEPHVRFGSRLCENAPQ
jgi:hypothetical protein